MGDHSTNHRQDLITIEHSGDVAVVMMNEPERRNPFSPAMCIALRDAFHHLHHEDQQSRAIVLTGAGGHFCSGEDLAEMTDSPAMLPYRNRMEIACGLVKLITGGNKPVVAAVEGSCIGAGLSLACAADFAAGASGSKYACAFVKLGLLPDTGLLWTLAQRTGHGRARELMLSGRSFDAETALGMGVLNHLVATGEALPAAIEQAGAFSALPPVSLALLKSALVNGMNTIEDAWRQEIDLNPLVRQTDDHHEAVEAFMEKRKASFTGK